MVARVRVHVEGVVQGVGFRPFVHGLAVRLDLAGFVANDSAGVVIEVQGEPARITEFVGCLCTEAPPLATVDSIHHEDIPLAGGTGFAISTSQALGDRRTAVTADSATCDDCLAELADPGNRRFRFPFINCTNCGPRYTIARDVPYDRPFTTMSGFAMCGDCAAEYADPGDRRFHAQPICCPACGPTLRLVDAAGTPIDGDPVTRTAELLYSGAVVAVKGLGGYHLAADAASATATAALRARKHREDKPFAVMVADLDWARSLCHVDDAAATRLTDRRRPIVLLDRRPGVTAWQMIAGPVAPGNRAIGLMLPYTPIHHLLLAEAPGPLVMTSGNVSDEPIAFRDEDAQVRLAGIADAYLIHDRPIHMRIDDSIVRLRGSSPMVLRRARGYAPEPIRLLTGRDRSPGAGDRAILACGGELKSTFCLVKDGRATMSPHIGDLENFETLRSYTQAITHFERLFDVKPELIAHDLHPDYLSTKYAVDRAVDEGLDQIGVQHHHAHIASCLADNNEAGPVLGVAFDGTGFGTDGTIWGGEFLLADLTGFERLGHLATVALPGGAAAIRQPWRMAAAYLDEAYAGEVPRLPVRDRNSTHWDAVIALSRSGLNSPRTSSAGRLFDAIGALLGIRDAVHYEGQAAIELEQRADVHERGAYPAAIADSAVITVAGADLVRAATEDLLRGTHRGAIAARFHNGLVAATARTCEVLRERTGVGTVALSGGVFQNMLLLQRCEAALTDAGFRVLTHSRIPPNDGGISFGQAAIAAARVPAIQAYQSASPAPVVAETSMNSRSGLT
jgi:hydrogenase maturation protein HypF